MYIGTYIASERVNFACWVLMSSISEIEFLLILEVFDSTEWFNVTLHHTIILIIIEMPSSHAWYDYVHYNVYVLGKHVALPLVNSL